MRKLFGIYIVFFLSIISTLIHAQQTTNPFEIVARMKTITSSNTTTINSTANITSNPFEIQNAIVQPNIDSTITIEDEVISENEETTTNNETVETLDTFPSPVAIAENISDSNNPFEIIESSSPKEEISEKPAELNLEENETLENEVTAVTPVKPKKQSDNFLRNIKPIGKSDRQQGQFFGLMLLTLVPVTILFMIFRPFFSKAYENILSPNVLNRSYREYAGASIIPMNVWYLVFLLKLGIFVSLLMNYYNAALTTQPLVNALICTGIVSGLIFGKRILLSFLGVIFPFKKEIQLYKYLLLLFGIVTGIFLAPINIAIIYASTSLLNILIYSSLALLLIFYLIRSYRALLIGNRFLVLDRFHFLLYICAVEIAPIFILVKLMMLYLA